MTLNPYDSVKGTAKPQWANQALATDGDMPMQFLTIDNRFQHADLKLNRKNLRSLDPYQGPPAVRELTTAVIKFLLRPRDWCPPPRGELFFLDPENIMLLLDHIEEIFKKEPTMLRLRAPMKVFGDIHGQYSDLLRHFDKYGMPTVSGDLALTDYLFLGDYVDRGSHSLETIILLICLKLQRPKNIFMIRGNHEVATMNNSYGFRLECMEKLGGSDGNNVWKRLNEVFNVMPLAALIDRKVLCMHGGIGPNVQTLDQIERIPRPVRAYFHDKEPYMPTLNEILWSDPADNDAVEGYLESERGPTLLKFGADKVNEFCTRNGLELIIRSHQCVMDGFERFASGRLVTVFSATNYCGLSRNNGAIIQLGRRLEIIVRTIQPKADDEEYWDAITNEQNPPSPMHSPRRAQQEDEESEDDYDEMEGDEDEDSSDDDESEEMEDDQGGHLPRSTHAHGGQGVPRVTARPLPPLALNPSGAPPPQRRPSDGIVKRVLLGAKAVLTGSGNEGSASPPQERSSGNSTSTGGGMTPAGGSQSSPPQAPPVQQFGRFAIAEEPLAGSGDGISPNRRKLPPVRGALP